jgi:uncharacterized membrane protein
MAQSSKKQAQKPRKKKNAWLLPTIAAVVIIVAAVFIFGDGGGSADLKSADVSVTKDADLVIPIGDISATAAFYPVEIDGTKLEVLAVTAPDGSVRTAFNTCQICYSSGRGYYEQEGNVLVCQNCGNRFQMSQVEVQSGGCNPVPIFADNKTVDDSSITISQEYLREAKGIFANWKTEY